MTTLGGGGGGRWKGKRGGETGMMSKGERVSACVGEEEEQVMRMGRDE